MHLPRFVHHRPSTLGEASQLLKEHGPKARVAAGGTDLYPRMKYGLDCPEAIISLKGIRAEAPTLPDDDQLRLDSLMTLADVVRSPLVLERAPLLGEAAHSVGSNQIRHMGTLGGNLCLEPRCTYFNQTHNYQYVEPCFKRNGDRCFLVSKGRNCQAVFMGDTVPALICLDAEVQIHSEDKTRQIPVEEFYTRDPLEPISLSGDELVGGVVIPIPAAPRATAFSKFSMRGGMEFGAHSAAVLLEMNENGRTCEVARIAVGSVSARPERAVKAEAALIGETLSEELLREVAKKIATETRLVMHHGYSVKFLKHSLEVQAYRTLTLAGKRVEQ